ncbi:unnamed protein product [Danaus chrysippus]|uniref:(African queen) hypothetical protein n=1 Tax=Danaus chrysippus TaxID=151541 RepID=A0A8J2QIB7_9NEOP|nr:unnamed protein product [Danaus chrysippus]
MNFVYFGKQTTVSDPVFNAFQTHPWLGRHYPDPGAVRGVNVSVPFTSSNYVKMQIYETKNNKDNNKNSPEIRRTVAIQDKKAVGLEGAMNWDNWPSVEFVVTDASFILRYDERSFMKML